MKIVLCVFYVCRYNIIVVCSTLIKKKSFNLIFSEIYFENNGVIQATYRVDKI